MRPTRRTVLASTAAAVSLAGCLGDGGGYGGGGNGGEETTTSTETTGATTGTTTPTTTTETTAPATASETTTTTTTTTTATTTPTTTTTAPPDTPGDETVVMRNVAFHPVETSVEPGTTVGWTNDDDFAHDVTSATFHDSATAWNLSETLAAGESTTYTFESPGIYEYYCSIHGRNSMCGVILVGDVSLDESLPCGADETTTTTMDDGYY